MLYVAKYPKFFTDFQPNTGSSYMQLWLSNYFFGFSLYCSFTSQSLFKTGHFARGKPWLWYIYYHLTLVIVVHFILDAMVNILSRIAKGFLCHNRQLVIRMSLHTALLYASLMISFVL